SRGTHKKLQQLPDLMATNGLVWLKLMAGRKRDAANNNESQTLPVKTCTGPEQGRTRLCLSYPAG
ncbi:MAG: hypothetical protein ACRD4F_01615, partial [Candidatus Angelobacter sp.]